MDQPSASGPALTAETSEMHSMGQTSAQPPHWMHSAPSIAEESKTGLTQQCRHRAPSARAATRSS